MKVWQYILNQLEKDIVLTLLYVLDSQGSSPGRKGFIMAVDELGQFEGTIGGGIMEVKMIELAKSRMKKEAHLPIIKEQFHDKLQRRNQSGLICSGHQKVALIPIGKKDIAIITAIIHRKDTLYLKLSSHNGLQVFEGKQVKKQQIHSETDFDCFLSIDRPKIIHIFGAGHVGLALAQQMSILGYKVMQYDDRPNLPILQKNSYAHEIKFINYQNLSECVETHPADIVVIVSFSYRTDKIILKQLYNQSLAYIGMMGSDHKIATLKKELAQEGIPTAALNHVFAPIGLNMYSKTAAEIAVSIAGQIILETNKDLPTGRNYEFSS